MTKKTVLALAAILMMAAAASASPVSINGKLKVDGLQLVSSCGNPVQLRGISTHGLQWFGGCYNDPSMSFVANTMNADVVRIALYVEQNGYISNPSYYTGVVDSLVDLIGSKGMYAIIDWHVLYVAGQSSGDPNFRKTDAEIFWQHEAAQHKGKPYVMYEICNEPSPGSVTWAMIKQYADDIIPKIRAIDPDTVIICGTPYWSKLGSDVVANQLSYPNVMYAFHFYAGSDSTSNLTPYVGSLPIFCTEWGASNSSGNGGDNYSNAQSFINIMGGANSAGVKISWASWSFADNTDSTSQLVSGSCGSGTYNLSTAGTFVKNNIMTPGKNFLSCGTPTATITGTPPTPTMTLTVTLTPTITITMTPYPFDMIYDGDTAGHTLADGSAVPNETHVVTAPTPWGTITETTGGAPNNAMFLKYQNPDFNQAHAWIFPAKAVGEYNNIMLDVKALTGTVTKFFYRPDDASTGVDLSLATGGINTSWQTIMVPLSSLYAVYPSTISKLRFADTSVSPAGYTVLIDNVKLVSVPSPTATPTGTQTFTATETHTISPTYTVSPTFTITPTFVPVLAIKDHYTYPNPSKGDKITFRYSHSGLAETVKIRVFTYSDRKIAEVMDSNKYAATGYSETAWTPQYRLGNGLYYYIVALSNSKKTVTGKIGTFVILRQ